MTQQVEQLGLKIDTKLLAKLRAVTDRSRNLYAPTQRQIVERGINLAIKELEQARKHAK